MVFFGSLEQRLPNIFDLFCVYVNECAFVRFECGQKKRATGDTMNWISIEKPKFTSVCIFTLSIIVVYATAYVMLSACTVEPIWMESNGEHRKPHAPIYALTVETILYRASENETDRKRVWAERKCKFQWMSLILLGIFISCIDVALKIEIQYKNRICGIHICVPIFNMTPIFYCI